MVAIDGVVFEVLVTLTGSIAFSTGCFVVIPINVCIFCSELFAIWIAVAQLQFCYHRHFLQLVEFRAHMPFDELLLRFPLRFVFLFVVLFLLLFVASCRQRSRWLLWGQPCRLRLIWCRAILGLDFLPFAIVIVTGVSASRCVVKLSIFALLHFSCVFSSWCNEAKLIIIYLYFLLTFSFIWSALSVWRLFTSLFWLLLLLLLFLVVLLLRHFLLNFIN